MEVATLILLWEETSICRRNDKEAALESAAGKDVSSTSEKTRTSPLKPAKYKASRHDKKGFVSISSQEEQRRLRGRRLVPAIQGSARRSGQLA